MGTNISQTQDPDGLMLLTQVRLAERKVRRSLIAIATLLLAAVLLISAGIWAMGYAIANPPPSATHGLASSIGRWLVIAGGVCLVCFLGWCLGWAHFVGKLDKLFKNRPVESLPTPEPELGEKFGMLRVVGIDDHSLHLAHRTPAGIIMARRFVLSLTTLTMLVLTVWVLVTRPFQLKMLKGVSLLPFLWMSFRPVALQFVVSRPDGANPLFTAEVLRYFFQRHLVEAVHRDQIILKRSRDEAVIAVEVDSLQRTHGNPSIGAQPIHLLNLGKTKSAIWRARRLAEAMAERIRPRTETHLDRV